MMLLISLATCVAFFYSLVMLFVDPARGFFWAMALLIDGMLLGHWLEMRSVCQASGALDQLARLLPDTAERIWADHHRCRRSVAGGRYCTGAAGRQCAS